MRQAEAALRLAGLDAASIRRVAEGSAMQDALVIRARAGGHRDRVEHQARPARSTLRDPLVRVADTGKLWLDIQLPVERQSRVTARRSVGIVGRDASAVASLGSTVSDNQTIVLRAQVTRGTALLRPGEFIAGPSGLCRWRRRLAVPVAAVARQDGKAYVFVRTEGLRGHAGGGTGQRRPGPGKGRCAPAGDRHHVRDRPESSPGSGKGRRREG